MSVSTLTLLSLAARVTQPPCAPRCVAAAAVSSPRSVVLNLRGGARVIETEDEFDALLADAGAKLVVVDFTASWCGPCQRIAPKYAELAEAYADDALLVKVDVDENAELAARMGVQVLPTFVVLRDGEEVAKMSGADAAKLEALVKEHIAAAVPA